MSSARIVSLNGSLSPSSRTRRLLQHVSDRVAAGTGSRAEIIDVSDFGPELGSLRARDQASAALEAAFRSFEGADLLLVGSPTYKGSYGGLFKHFIDFIDYRSLVGRPVGLLATGGSHRHALVVEHQLRPLFGFFIAHTLPTAVFVSEQDMVEGIIVDPLLQQRIDQLVEEARLALSPVRLAA